MLFKYAHFIIYGRMKQEKRNLRFQTLFIIGEKHYIIIVKE